MKSEDSEKKQLEFDELLPHAGEFGLYQTYLFFISFPFYFYYSFVYFNQIFLTEPPSQYWCWVPELNNLSAIERRSLAIPKSLDNSFGYSRCRVYKANWTEVLTNRIPPDPATPTTKCAYGWEYNMTDIPYLTTASEFNWVCDKDSYQATAQAIFFMGSVAGGLILGWVSDRFGRIPTAVVTNVIGCVGGVASAYAQNFWQFAVARFVIGMAYDNCLMMIYILVLEYIAPKYRTAISNLAFALFYTLASCALPWIALACNHWRTLALATSLPMALALLTPLAVPESPRWLLSKGRVDEALQKLNKIATINKKVVPEQLLNEFRVQSSKTESVEEKFTVLDLFKHPYLRKMMFLVCLEYMLISIMFDCLVRLVGQLGSDFFTSFTVASLTECPSLILLVFVMDWLGRRWMTAGCCAIACIFTILSGFVPKGAASVSCAVVARFVTNMSYNSIIQWTVELLPSSARGAGAGFVHVCGYLATIASPYIIYLETFHSYLPQVVVGAVCAMGTVVALLLAETSGEVMPQTCADAAALGTRHGFWHLPRSRKPKHVETDKTIPRF